MNLPYFLRLACLCLASAFLVHLAAGAAVAALSPAAVRRARRMRPRAGAQLLLGMRLAPAFCGLLVVAVLCVPAYLWHEPEPALERVGFACLTAALLGAALWANSLTRALWAALRTSLFLKRCLTVGRNVAVAGEPAPVCVMEEQAPAMMLAGLFRPRLVMAARVMESLSAEQLSAAIRHERAHRESRDNLLRFLILAAPGFPALDRLECGWAQMAEWAADDSAADGNPEASLALASALVRVTRLATAGEERVLATSLIAGNDDLPVRVDRLLRSDEVAPEPGCVPLWLPAGISACAAAAIGAAWPATLEPVHWMLEQLLR